MGAMEPRRNGAATVDPGDWIRVYTGPKRARLVRPKPINFLARVRDRLGVLGATAALADGEPPLIYLPDDPVPPDMAHLRQPRRGRHARRSGQMQLLHRARPRPCTREAPHSLVK